jgi:hypothetical protein
MGGANFLRRKRVADVRRQFRSLFPQKEIGYPATSLNEKGSGLFSIEE